MKEKESKEINNSLKLLISASFIILLTTILSKILAYLYRIVIAREFGPEVYGIYSISLMVIGLVTVLAGVGLVGGLNRYIPYYRGKNEEDKSSYLLKKITSFLIISGIIGLLFVIFTSGFISDKIFKIAELKSSLIIFSFAIPLILVAGVYFSVLRSYEKIGWFAFIVNILQTSVKLLVLVSLIYLGFSSESIAVSFVAGIAIALFVAYIVSRKKIPLLFKKRKVNKGKEAMRELLSYSWPLIFFGFISSILSWTDTFMIGVLRTPSEVGFYNAAFPIALIITLSTDLFRQMLLPIIAKEYGKGNMIAVKVISRQVTKWLFIVSIPLFAALFIFPQEAIKLLFGVEYLPAANALRILTLGFFVFSVLDVSRAVLSMKGKSKLILVDIIIVAAIGLLLNYLLIPLYGISGAAISTTISLIILSILFTYQSWKATSIPPFKREVLKVVFAGFISFTLAWIVSVYIGKGFWGVILSGLLFLIVYLISLHLTRSIDANDYLIINAIKSKTARIKSNVLSVFD